MPIVIVSLVDRDRQWFKSRQGIDVTQTPREISFCTHTIQSNEPLIIRDAHADPRFTQNPLVVNDPNVANPRPATISTICYPGVEAGHLANARTICA